MSFFRRLLVILLLGLSLLGIDACSSCLDHLHAADPSSGADDAVNEKELVRQILDKWDAIRDEVVTAELDAMYVVWFPKELKTAPTRGQMRSFVVERLLPLVEEHADKQSLQAATSAFLASGDWEERFWWDIRIVQDPGGVRNDLDAKSQNKTSPDALAKLSKEQADAILSRKHVETKHTQVRRKDSDIRFDGGVSYRQVLVNRGSAVKMYKLSDLRPLPPVRLIRKTKLEDWQLTRIDADEVMLVKQHLSVTVYPSTGLLSEMAIPGYESLSFLPQVFEGGITVPRLTAILYLDSMPSGEQRLSRFTCFVLKSAVINEELDDDAFDVSVPAGTKVVSLMDKDHPKVHVAEEAVPNVEGYIANMPANNLEPREPLEGGASLTTILLFVFNCGMCVFFFCFLWLRVRRRRS